MLDKIFNSKTRVKTLSLFFENPDKAFYVQEIIRLTKADAANVHRELMRLKKFGLFTSFKKGNQKYYQINKDFEYYQGLEKIFEKYNQAHGPEAWTCLEEMPNYYPMMAHIAFDVNLSNGTLKKYKLKNRFSKLLTRYKNNFGGFFVIKNEFNLISHELVDLIIKKPNILKKYNLELKQDAKKFFKTTTEWEKTNFVSLNNNELAQVYKKYYDTYTNIHLHHWMQTCLDFGDNVLSKYLINYLKERVLNTHLSVGDVFSILTTPTEEGNVSREYRDLLGIYKEITKNKKIKEYFKKNDTRIIEENLKMLNNGLDKKITNHARKYGWLGYNTVGPAWSREYFIDILGSFARQGISPDLLLKKQIKEREYIKNKQKKLIKKLNIDKKHQLIFKNTRDIVYTKGLRKDCMFYSYFTMENFFKELGKRFYISIRQARYLIPDEVYEVLKGSKKIDVAMLNERFNFSFYNSKKKQKKNKFLIKKEALSFSERINIIEENVDDIKTLLGDCASPGRVKGRVSVINVPEDMKKMKKGNILVSIATTPDLVPAIKKASSIITDMGGVTCHAAIVSRELGIPCVVGTKLATKVLEDGDTVDVDATHGKAYIIK